MPSFGELDACAVEIRVPLPGDQPWRKGSGYLIGPHRVLTSLHVLVGEEAVLNGQPVSAPGLIEIRAYGDFKERFVRPNVVLEQFAENLDRIAQNEDYFWRPAGLIWPRDGAPVPNYDLAILEVRPENALRSVRTAPRITCFAPDKDLMCRAFGFPAWNAEVVNGADIGSPRAVTGKLTYSDPNYRTFHIFTVDNGAPPEGKGWQRLSGSAFLAQDTGKLVGVATALQNEHGNCGLWLTQLSDLDNHEFQEFWEKAELQRPAPDPVAAAANRTVPKFPINPLAYLHEFDRTTPQDRILDIIDPLPLDPTPAGIDLVAPDPLTPQVPVVFVIAGRLIDLPERLVERIQKKIAPAYFGSRDGDAVTLKWRYAAERYLPNVAVANLRAKIAESLKATNPRGVASLSALGNSASGRDWIIYIDIDRITEQDAETLRLLLDEFSNFGRLQRPPLLYINILPSGHRQEAAPDPMVENFMKLARLSEIAVPDRILIIDDLHLQDCEYLDIREWTETINGLCPRTAEQVRDFLEARFTEGMKYPLKLVEECLKGAISVP